MNCVVFQGGQGLFSVAARTLVGCGREGCRAIGGRRKGPEMTLLPQPHVCGQHCRAHCPSERDSSCPYLSQHTSWWEEAPARPHKRPKPLSPNSEESGPPIAGSLGSSWVPASCVASGQRLSSLNSDSQKQPVHLAQRALGTMPGPRHRPTHRSPSCCQVSSVSRASFHRCWAPTARWREGFLGVPSPL